MRSGTVRPRGHITLHRHTATGPADVTGRPSSVAVFQHGAVPEAGNATAGSIATLGGLRDVAIGDWLGDAPEATGQPAVPAH